MSEIRSVTVPLLTNAKGLDAKIQEIQLELVAGLEWLSCSYGKALILKDEIEGDRIGSTEQRATVTSGIYTVPKVYIKNREYLRLEPNDEVDAFSFMYRQGDEQATAFKKRSSTISLVVFANTERAIFNEGDTLFIEDLKEQVLAILSKDSIRSFTPVEDNRTIKFDLDEAWGDFTFPDTKGRYMRENYVTFRIDFEIFYASECNNDIFLEEFLLVTGDGTFIVNGAGDNIAVIS